LPSSRRQRHQARNKKQSPSRGRQGAPPPANPKRHFSAPHAAAAGVVEGILQLKGRVGFILTDNPKLSDVLVEGPTLRLAMDGDRVRAKLISGREATRRYGQITEILTHARNTFVGAFQKVGSVPCLVPEDDGAPLVLTDAGNPSPQLGELAVARITRWPTETQPAAGKLIEVLGERDLPGVDLLILRRKYTLPDVFPAAVEAEAVRWGREVPPDAYATRETFFDHRVFTIDGADAKDFDDAVSLEKRPGGGWRLGVHIADVSHYVQEGTALDDEALSRGTSVYLKSTVIPMLPFALSDHLCSLLPDQVRLTLTCLMDIDPDGRIIESRICESAIKSSVRFTYDAVELILNGKTLPDVPADIQKDVLEMNKLALILRKRRFARGSLDFDFPEPDVQFDAQGRPLSILTKMRLESHKLIEDFMLAANESVATQMSAGPFIYRIHESPDPAKIEKLSQTLKAVGMVIPKKMAEGEPAGLQQILNACQGTPTERLVESLTLRSLKQAVYSAVNKGHFGLASKCYTHFTSPIRRYPDLLVHRLIRKMLRNEKARLPVKEQNEKIAEVALKSSKRERLAVDAEREYFDVLKVRLMQEHVGEEFEGVISSITSFGFFVQLKEHFVEGLVRLANLKEDFFIFDELRMSLRGRRTGMNFQLGQSVRVKLAAANIIKRQLDLEWLPPPKKQRAN
jgi:ribonuclease R